MHYIPVKKSRNVLVLGFRDLVHLQQLKGMQSSRYVKGVPFFNRKVYERDYFSVKNSI